MVKINRLKVVLVEKEKSGKGIINVKEEEKKVGRPIREVNMYC